MKKLRNLPLKQRLKYWKRRLKIRRARLQRSSKERRELDRIIKVANARIKRLRHNGRLVSEDGVNFVAYFEGFPNGGKPYNDPVGHCTIGYGHLLHYGNCTPTDHERWGRLTEKEAKLLLKEDLHEFAKGVRDKTVLWDKLNQNERDALVSFAFNVGLGAYEESTLLKKLNKGDKRGAADEFPRWVYASSQKLPGLVRRRAAERKMFLGV